MKSMKKKSGGTECTKCDMGVVAGKDYSGRTQALIRSIMVNMALVENQQ